MAQAGRNDIDTGHGASRNSTWIVSRTSACWELNKMPQFQFIPIVSSDKKIALHELEEPVIIQTVHNSRVHLLRYVYICSANAVLPTN